jgi:hypothetical protein
LSKFHLFVSFAKFFFFFLTQGIGAARAGNPLLVERRGEVFLLQRPPASEAQLGLTIRQPVSH